MRPLCYGLWQLQLNEKYNGQYVAVGVVILLNAIAALGALAMISMIVILVFEAIKNSEI